MIYVREHAIDQYLSRILEVPPEIAGETVREYSRKRLIEVKEECDFKFHQEKDMCPIYVKGEVAIPVDDGVIITTLYSEPFWGRYEGR